MQRDFVCGINCFPHVAVVNMLFREGKLFVEYGKRRISPEGEIIYVPILPVANCTMYSPGSILQTVASLIART